MIRLFYIAIIPLILIFQAYCYSSEATGKETGYPGREAIVDLSKKFQEAIAQQDSRKLVSLFFSHDSPIIGIMSAKTEAAYKKNNPGFQGIATSNAKKFADDIRLQFQLPQEIIQNLEIHQDSTLASVSFDYSFYSEGKVKQWGKEYWNLVWADNQWLITSINYVIRDARVEPLPQK